MGKGRKGWGEESRTRNGDREMEGMVEGQGKMVGRKLTKGKATGAMETDVGKWMKRDKVRTSGVLLSGRTVAPLTTIAFCECQYYGNRH